MPNLATNKNEISTGLAVKPVHITDCIDALTGAKTFDDVKTPAQVLATPLNPMSAPISTTYKAIPFNVLAGKSVISNNGNTKAYGVRHVDLGQESVGFQPIDNFLCGDSALRPITNSFSLLITDINLNVDITSGGLPVFSIKDSGFVGIYTSSTKNVITFRISDGILSPIISQSISLKPNSKQMLITVDRTAKKAFLYIDNVLTSTLVLPDNFGSIIVSSAGLTVAGSNNSVFGVLNRVQFFNYAFTQSDVSYYWNNGRHDLALVRDYDKWGSNTNSFTSFSGLDTWTNAGGGVYTISNNGGSAYVTGFLKAGKRYRLSFTIDSISGGGVILKSGNSIITTGVKTSSGTYSIEGINTSSDTNFVLQATAGTTAQVSNLSVIQLGSVADYSPASIADPALITGAITSVVGGNTYQVVSELSTTDRYTIGAPGIAVGTRFVATNATAYTITSGKVQLIAVTSWLDNSTNALNATVSGNPMLVKTQVETSQGDGIKSTLYLSAQFTASGAGPHDTAFDVTAGWMIDEIGIDRTAGTGSRSLTIKALTSSGTTIATCTHADDYSSTVELQNLNNFVFTKKRMSKTTNVRLFLTGSQAGDSWILNIRLKVAQ